MIPVMRNPTPKKEPKTLHVFVELSGTQVRVAGMSLCNSSRQLF